MEQRVRDICVTALSHLCAWSSWKSAEFLRSFTFIHTAQSRVFLQRGIQFADSYHSASCPPTHPHPADTSCRDAAQTALIVSTLFSSSQTSHWFMTLHLIIHRASCSWLRLHVFTAFKCHLHASTCRNRTWIHHIHTLPWWIRLCAFSLVNENKHKRCSFVLLCLRHLLQLCVSSWG